MQEFKRAIWYYYKSLIITLINYIKCSKNILNLFYKDRRTENVSSKRIKQRINKKVDRQILLPFFTLAQMIRSEGWFASGLSSISQCVDESFWANVALTLLLIKIHAIRAFYALFSIPEGFLWGTEALVGLWVEYCLGETLTSFGVRTKNSREGASNRDRFNWDRLKDRLFRGWDFVTVVDCFSIRASIIVSAQSIWELLMGNSQL